LFLFGVWDTRYDTMGQRGAPHAFKLLCFYVLINYYCLLISVSLPVMLDYDGDTLLDFREAGLGEVFALKMWMSYSL